MAGSTSGADARSGRGVWIGVAVVVLLLGLVVVWSGRRSDARPFDIASSAPDGYRALAILLRDRGADVSAVRAASLSERPTPPGAALVVPAPELLDAGEQRRVLDAARSGSVVVLGSPLADDAGRQDPSASTSVHPDAPSRRELVDSPATPTRPGRCEILRLAGLGAVDTAFAGPLPQHRSVSSCYDDPTGPYVAEEPLGQGAVITLGSPYMWSNARLQPAKEEGGRPLDNAALALRLLGRSAAGADGDTLVEFVAAVPTAGVSPNGTRNPMEMLPTGVKLALAQLLGAFVLYAWWRSRRLGSVVVERMPVEIDGSELVAAVGDLLRRKGTPGNAAAVLRRDTCRRLARGLGVPVDAPTAVLVAAVAPHTHRDPAHLATLLGDNVVDTPEALVRLAEDLTDICQEVLLSHV